MASLNPTMNEALNKQLNAEMYSANLYLALASYFENLDLGGFANWMRVQADEELFHVKKLFNYIVERGGRVRVGAVAAPPAEWDSPLAGFEASFDHEQSISAEISDLVDLSLENRDRGTESFMRWYVDEQVEEEASVDRVVKMLRLSEGQPAAMLILDRELAGRSFKEPAAG